MTDVKYIIMEKKINIFEKYSILYKIFEKRRINLIFMKSQNFGY